MRAPTRLLLALLAGATLIAGAMAVVFISNRAGQPSPVTVRIITALPAEPWVSDAARRYNATRPTIEGAPVTIDVIPMDGVSALNRWSRGDWDRVPTAWLAETRDWVGQANVAVAERLGRDVFLPGGEYRDQPVALSPQVWAIFESRYRVLNARYGADGAVDWRDIHDAALSRNWAALGGQPEWGRFKLVIPHPKRDPAGLAAMVAAAGAYYGKASVSTEDLKNPQFQTWLRETLDSVVDFSPFGVENMLLFGYSNGDAGQVIEAYLLTNMEGLQRRWKEPLVIQYPDPITWFDFPFAIYMGPETPAAEKNAALDFKRYLLSVEQQQNALRYGLRPANPDVPMNVEGSLIARWSAMGFREQVPSASRMRPASRSGVVELLNWFVRTYEQ
ncbi:MAG: substrate-binding domain-containing protein [Chloroflexota bacterium]|nr:substrate-binding domain-containing protein [Dehalococcoidia bacterium]MDW8252685.1 substrate-binding domain-containing protein [Chloroflexota bacterium]